MNLAYVISIILFFISLVCFVGDQDIYGLFFIGCAALWQAVGYVENLFINHPRKKFSFKETNLIGKCNVD